MPDNSRLGTPDQLITSSESLQACIDRISFDNSLFSDWKFRFHFAPVSISGGGSEREGWLVWCLFTRPETHTGQLGTGKSRDEFVAHGATESSVIKTCWLLIELLVRHELMEGYRVDGRRIFDPHNTIADLQLAQTIGTRACKYRKEA